MRPRSTCMRPLLLRSRPQNNSHLGHSCFSQYFSHKEDDPCSRSPRARRGIMRTPPFPLNLFVLSFHARTCEFVSMHRLENISWRRISRVDHSRVRYQVDSFFPPSWKRVPARDGVWVCANYVCDTSLPCACARSLIHTRQVSSVWPLLVRRCTT